MCCDVVAKARTPKGRDAKWLVQRQRRVRTKANPMAAGIDRWLRVTRDLWMADVNAALEHGGLARLEQLTERKTPGPSKPERRARTAEVGKAMSGDDIAGLEAMLQRMFRKYGLLQINSAGKSAARAVGGNWVFRPELAAEWNDKLANKVVLLVDETRGQIQGDIKRIVSDALKEMPRPTSRELARRIARQWYGPAGKRPPGWPGRGTTEEQRVTADWARTQGQLDEGGREYLFSHTRANTIARTELSQAENAAIAESFSQSNIKLVGWLAFPYNADHDGPGKRNHYLMNKHPPITVEAMQGTDKGRWFKLPNGERAPYPNWIGLSAGNSVNCLLPDTRVAGSFVGGLRARYSGDAVYIKTRSGRTLAVTPNHPILTTKGYRAASTLSQGDDLLCQARELESDVGLDGENGPAPVAEIFGALVDVRKPSRMGLAPVDLHGDAAGCDGDVEIVDLNRKLLFDCDTGGADSFRNLGLVAPEPELPDPHSLGAFPLLRDGVLAPAGGGIGRRDLLSPRADPLPDPSQFLRFGNTADIHTSGYQPATYDVSAGIEPEGDLLFGRASLIHRDNDVGVDLVSRSVPNRDRGGEKPAVDGSGGGLELAAELRLRYPARVKLDQVVTIDVGSFSGHVYDLQSEPGWIVAEGLFSSNCQCTSVPRRG